MVENPLKKYFRQPKIYISLPSKGVYNKLGSTQGDLTNMPVYGMTGMDEILMKTPDALITGESTVKVMESCCPYIKDGWEVSSLDSDLIFAAIRIATYGNVMNLTHTCTKCNTETDFDFSLNKFIDHWQAAIFQNKITIDDLTVIIRPLTFKESNSISLKNFEIQKKLQQVMGVEDEEEQKKLVKEILFEMSELQNSVFSLSVEAVETPAGRVEEPEFIREWLANCDTALFTTLKKQFETNRENMNVPPQPVTCSSCGHEDQVAVTLDQANFFVNA